MTARICGFTGGAYFRKLSFHGTGHDRFPLGRASKVIHQAILLRKLPALCICSLALTTSGNVTEVCRVVCNSHTHTPKYEILTKRDYEVTYYVHLCVACQKRMRSVPSLCWAQRAWSGTPSPIWTTSSPGYTSECILSVPRLACATACSL